MRRREVETAPEKRQLWEKEQNKQDKKIFSSTLTLLSYTISF